MAPTSNRRSHSRLSVAARWSGNVRSLSNAAGVTLVQAFGDDYARDLGVFDVEGSEYPGCTVYQKDGDRVRVFYNGEMPAEAADPGQYPRGAVDIAPLWNLLDMTPSGRARIGIPSSNTELDRFGMRSRRSDAFLLWIARIGGAPQSGSEVRLWAPRDQGPADRTGTQTRVDAGWPYDRPRLPTIVTMANRMTIMGNARRDGLSS